MTAEQFARILRLETIRGMLASNQLDEASAKELLMGPLNPDDKSTIYDDAELLHDENAREKILKVQS